MYVVKSGLGMTTIIFQEVQSGQTALSLFFVPNRVALCLLRHEKFSRQSFSGVQQTFAIGCTH
jgi:hypothetical protein